MSELEPRPADGVRYVITGRPGLDDRPTLPAGHRVSWGAITAGTVLDGAEYPHAVFLDRSAHAA